MPERLKETKPKAELAANARAGAVRKTFVVSDTPAGKAAPRDKAQRITFPGDAAELTETRKE